MSTRWVLRNSKARFFPTFSTTTLSSSTPVEFYPTPCIFATTYKVLGCQGTYLCGFRAFHGPRFHQKNRSVVEEQLDPYSLVADDLLVVASRLKSTFAAEVPMLASAAGDFFKMGAERKKFRPTVILLMASALNMSTLAPDGMLETSYNELYDRQLSIAVITEMIHAASLLHSDVLDDAETRCGIGSLNCFMENKMAVLAGDVLLSRALVALTSLGSNEASEILGKSNGIQRAIELASEHANLAAAAIKSLPKTDNADVRRSRQALVDLTRFVITRKR